MFNDNLDVVFAALEKDILTRNETQDWAVNIIVGIGSYKDKLSKGGKLIFENLFNNIKSSHKNIYILMDDYEKIKGIKPEPWFSQFDLSNGLWIGKGFETQSILSSNMMSQEDKKLQFEGIGYTVISGVYNVVKVVRDGDD